ncbi:preprotein translocase YajC subunit [Brevibacterium sanguinis]|uniref:Preprotein translocase YajC subunit n=2 Tax=Brevibacterium TaxID=1696 RepID=A0A366IJJ0_9MICO|nr:MULTISPECIES: preprotein translocase subunit YajC [Brevibacterium]RBP63914.1 preprotein translocase YajC subunit [Brevibacterium sanguinis]RBP70811.1 preprotein translocase YajC subunit [Brevibacterium celere]
MDLLIPLALAALLIFFLFNSRRKQKARMEQIKTNLVPGASVMTTFGVFGTVVAIDEENNQVTIESGPGTTLRVHRQAIGQIDTPGAADPAAGAAGTDAPGDTTEAPAITDAELDAMIERKRAESGDSDSVNGASAVDPAEARTDSADDAVDTDTTAGAGTTAGADDTVDDSTTGPKDATDADPRGTDSEGPDTDTSGTDKKN